MTPTFWKVFSMAFGSVFLAELGDKTQLLTGKLQATHKLPVAIFLGAASALVVSSLMAVLLGDVLHRMLPEQCINDLFGMLFIFIGVLMLMGRF